MTAAFATETPDQIARHAEIARRYARKPSGQVEKLSPLRGRAMRRRREITAAGQWRQQHDPGWSPDPGQWAAALADTLRFTGGNADDLRSLAYDAGVRLDHRTVHAAMADATARRSPQPLSGITAGRLIDLTCEQRLACGITTMNATDESPEERKERVAAARRERDRLRKRRKRAAARRPSAEATRPWEAVGMSRRTWYRCGKPMLDPAGTDPVPPPFKDVAADTSSATPGTADPEAPSPDSPSPVPSAAPAGGGALERRRAMISGMSGEERRSPPVRGGALNPPLPAAGSGGDPSTLPLGRADHAPPSPPGHAGDSLLGDRTGSSAVPREPRLTPAALGIEVVAVTRTIAVVPGYGRGDSVRRVTVSLPRVRFLEDPAPAPPSAPMPPAAAPAPPARVLRGAPRCGCAAPGLKLVSGRSHG